MKSLLLKSSIIVLAASAAGCAAEGAKDSASRTEAIGTDLGDTGVATDETYLYWVDGDTTFRGQCHFGKPMLKVNCSSHMKSMGTESFQAALDAGVSSRVITLKKKVAKLLVDIDLIEERIELVVKEIEKKKDELAADQGQLNAANAQIATLKGFVKEFEEQLKAIDAELASMNDPELLEQRGEVVANLDGYQGELAKLVKSLETITAEIAGDQSALNSLCAEFERLSKDLDSLTDALQKAQANLGVAIAEFVAFEDTMKKLSSAVIYTVRSDDDKFAANRPYVKRFDDIFVAAADKN